MNTIGWFLMIGNIVSGILNMWVAFNGFPPNFVVGVLNFIVGGWILKLLLED